MSRHVKLLALLLALLMAVSLTACGKKPEPVSPSSVSEPQSEAPSESGKDRIFINTLSQTDTSRFPRFTKRVNEYKERNSDTVGWLEVPGTHIDDVIVCNTDPKDYNDFYYRRNFDKEYSFNGIFYADFRSKFGDGSAAQLPHNTVIYGHTLSADRDGVMFAPLKYFTDEDFARETPYVYFSTGKEDLVFEIFSVFYVTVDLPYNRPDLSQAEFSDVVNECIKRSIWIYDTQVTADDKIITLSTCTYSVPGIGAVKYPNNYRYVVMGKLVNRSAASKTEATFVTNPAPKAP